MALLTGGRRRGAALLASLAALALLSAATTAPGHAGGRLRMGYRPDALLPSLARLAEVYLEEVSGYQVDLKEFPDAFALQAAVRKGDVDVAVEYPAEAWARTACPTTGAFQGNIFDLVKAYYRENYGAVWVASPTLGRDPCHTPSWVITRPVADDLAYYTLPDYLRKLARAIQPEDADGLLSSARGIDPGALRELLAKKRLI